jgi:hypothetical protein
MNYSTKCFESKAVWFILGAVNLGQALIRSQERATGKLALKEPNLTCKIMLDLSQEG